LTVRSRIHPRHFVALAITLVAVVAIHLSTLGVASRAGIIAAVCLMLWLTQWVPVWVPTLLLWLATPALLWRLDQRFTPLEVVQWSVDPVLALFLGGFALAAAARTHGIDASVATVALRIAGRSPTRLLAAAAFATALLSMWMSNVAAAALMLNAFRPIWDREPAGSALRRSLLLVIALSADVGGISTPIGTGANGIALAAVAHVRHISFLHWMAFGVPLAAGLVLAALVLVVVRLRPSAPVRPPALPPLALMADSANNASVNHSATDGSMAGERASGEPLPAPSANNAKLPPKLSRSLLGVVFAVTVLLWLSEPWHGIVAWTVALGAVLALLVLRVLPWTELRHLDWGTLLLVAGGIGMGALLDRSGIVHLMAGRLPLQDLPEFVRIFSLCVVSATLSALMSNTGTAALLIPLAATIDPSPSTAIIVAVAASLGVPFVVSTPPNAMAVAGGLKSTDLLIPGLILMFGGCLLIALTGHWVLRAVGIP